MKLSLTATIFALASGIASAPLTPPANSAAIEARQAGYGQGTLGYAVSNDWPFTLPGRYTLHSDIVTDAIVM